MKRGSERGKGDREGKWEGRYKWEYGEKRKMTVGMEVSAKGIMKGRRKIGGGEGRKTECITISD
jgi:hypothetical protein